MIRALLFFGLALSQLSFAESQNLQLLGKMNKYPQEGYASCWGYTAPNGTEYALLGVDHGLSIVDISDPANLVESAFVAAGKSSSWTEVKAYKNFAYFVKDNASTGIQIVDLSQLPTSVKLVNTLMTTPQNHTLWIDEARGWMFTVGGSNDGVTVWSLQDPVNPQVIATFNKSVYVHDMYVHGNRAYLAEIMSRSFSIYDISDINNPKFISRLRDKNAPSISFHNMWTTDDGRFLFTTEESSGRAIRVWDLKDEANPVQVASFLGPNKLAHNVHVKGNFLHVAHYGAGYRVWDFSNILNPVEVANYDKDNKSTEGFNGVWGIYPYFKSNKVIMSDIEDGLFVVKFDQ